MIQPIFICYCFLYLLSFVAGFIFPVLTCAAADEITANRAYTLGPEQIVYEPKDFWIDGPYFTYTWQGQTYGVLPSDISSRTTDAVSPQIRNRGKMSGLGLGASGEWDELGAWLNGIYQDSSGRLHGFYHGESKSKPISKFRNRASLGYVYSDDGGKHWVKPQYPDNRIITGQNNDDYAGDARLVVRKDGLFMYFGQTDGEHLAMSALSDKGLPGTWKRFLENNAATEDGNFSVPATKGNGTILQGLRYGAFVVWNTHLKQWLAVDGDFNGEANRHLILKVSDDGISWKQLSEQSLPLPQTYPKLTVYPSLVGINGESETGQSFWLYYVYLTSPNTLARMKVTLSP